MLTFPNREALRCACLSADLIAIVADILDQAAKADLLDLTLIAVIQPGDSEKVIVEAIGWSPLFDPIGELRYDQPGFEPYWASLCQRGDWYELWHILGTAFAYVLIIPRVDGGDLAAMCRHHSEVAL